MELGEAIKYYVLITYQALLTNLFSVKVEQTRKHKAICWAIIEAYIMT